MLTKLFLLICLNKVKMKKGLFRMDSWLCEKSINVCEMFTY